MTDHFGFTMASINENGSVFANPCKGEKNLSTLMYRPFCSWASNSEVGKFSLLCSNLVISKPLNLSKQSSTAICTVSLSHMLIHSHSNISVVYAI